MPQFKSEFVTKSDIDARFNDRLRNLELARVDAAINEVSPTGAVGTGFVQPQPVFDPADASLTENKESQVDVIEKEILAVRDLRDEVLKSAVAES